MPLGLEEREKEHSCCFSGHRKLPQEQIEEIRERLKVEVIRLISKGVNTFYSGYASGFDTEATLTVNELKQEYPHIKLILVLPYRQEINISYDKCVCISETFKKGCFHIRNRYMVDNSGYCVCYLTEGKGGTAYTVNYARQKGLEIYNITAKRA